MLDRLRAIDALDDRVGQLEGCVDVALPDAAMVVRPEVGIHRPPLMDRRPVGVHRLADVEERGSLLEFDLDQAHRLAGGVLVDGRYGRDRLALLWMDLAAHDCLDRANDLDVTGAAADVARQCLEYVLTLRIGVTLEESRCRQHEAGRAEAALRGVVLVEGCLHRRERIRSAEALDCRDHGSVDCRERQQTRAPRLPVDEHGASPAAALFAAGLRACEVEFLAERGQKRSERWTLDVVRDGVDGEFHSPPSRLSSARRTRTGSVRRRYQADASASSRSSTSSRTFSAASCVDAPPASACSTDLARTP